MKISPQKKSIERSFLTCLLPIMFFFAAVMSAHSEPAIETGDFRLIGTIQGKAFTGAVVDNAKGEQLFYKLHELLPDGSKIVKVEADNITIRQADGMLYVMFINRAKAVSMPAPAPVSIPANPSPAYEPPPTRNQDERGPLYKSGIGKRKHREAKPIDDKEE